ncbi:Uncharacterized protein TCAP_01845 [Tolypocladium capitatum]|uniref:Chitinase n=1 Tax=Tolypocladium capitatum TaxID=45235 RepID=A0A2K3QL62_9HYPO|nr:Uncharacterized protein TCAP_01845 [Tolypocladium capitatum]
MITKAGVHAGKIVVGVSSYGRSFGMTDRNCAGPMCTFAGPNSGAAPGQCTQTAGYISNYEIELIAQKRASLHHHDDPSDSDILIYDNNWVAYMTEDTKSKRQATYHHLGMAGTTDWAIDLQADKGKNSTNRKEKGCVNWREVRCSSNWVADPTQDQEKRWLGVGADCAWEKLVETWKANPRGFSFSNTASEIFFKGRQNMQCMKIADHSNCDQTFQCNDSQDLYPAGYFILSSMVNIYQMHANMYGALNRLRSKIQGEIPAMTSKFAPVLQEPESLKIVIDIVGMGYAALAAPLWNSWLKRFAFFKDNSNTLGVSKDTTNGLVSNSLSLVKDASVAGQTLNVQNSVGETFGQLVDMWALLIEQANEMLFNGTDDGVQRLGDMMAKGKMMEPGEGLSDLEIQNLLAYAIYGTLIPRAWNAVRTFPVVIDSGKACNDANFDYTFMDKDDAEKTKGCVDNRMYYLMAPIGLGWSCSGSESGAGPCYDNNFLVPPGAETMDGKNWGGVTPADLISGAVRSFKANGNKNGWGSPNLGNERVIADITENGIKTAGFIPIPVCGRQEAHDNWARHDVDRWDNYPCNK